MFSQFRWFNNKRGKIEQNFSSVSHSSPNLVAKRAGRDAFTLAEIVVVASLMLLVAVIVFTGLINFATRQNLNSVSEDIRLRMREARDKTLMSENNKNYGVYVGTTSVAFFIGSNFSPATSTNEYIDYEGSIIATSSLTGGTTTVVFSRLSGEASATGTVTVVDTLTGASTSITIYKTGLIE
jgi:Tfp pilus assembly protein FimT